MEIDDFYHQSSQKLLTILVKDHNLFEHLEAVRKYLLFGDYGAELMAHFFSISETILEQNLDLENPNVFSLQQAKIERLLEVSLHSYELNSSDAGKEHVKADLKSCDYVTEIAKILTINTSEENLTENTQKKSLLTGEKPLRVMDVITLDWKSTWPNNIVLSKKSLTHYQMLFRHLFHCKNVEREINNLWRINMSLFKQKSWFRRSIFEIMMMMKNFVTTLQYFMSTEVIEPNWQKFVENLKKNVKDLDELIEHQNEFLSSCMKSCLLSQPKPLTSITKLLYPDRIIFNDDI